MPIFSYVAIPIDGGKDALCSDLASMAHCQIVPADNREIVVLVTDTPDETTEEALQESLKNLQSLQSLNLAFGYDENSGEE